MTDSANKFYYTWFVCVILILCYIFMPHLLRTMRHDEAYTFFFYAQSPINALFNYSTPNNHLLHSFLMWIVLQVMGTSVLAIRFVAFASSLIMFALVWKITMRLVSDIRIAILGVLLLAAMPFIAEYIVNGRGYTLSAVLALLYVDFVSKHSIELTRPQRRILVVLIFLNILTLPTMLILIASVMLWVTYRGIKTRKFDALTSYYVDTIFASLLGTLFYTSGLVTGLISEFSSTFGYQTTFALMTDFLTLLSPSIGTVFIFAGFIVGLIYLYIKQCPRLLLVSCLFMIPIILSLIQEWVTGGVLFPRSYFYLLPFIAIITACAIAFIPKTYTPNVILVVGVVLLSSWIWYQHQSLSYPNSIDALLSVVNDNAEDTDLLIIACCENYPIYYHFYVDNESSQSALFQRLILIPNERTSFDNLISNNGITSDVKCQDDRWQTYPIYICEVPDYLNS